MDARHLFKRMRDALQRYPDDRDLHLAMARFLLRSEKDLTDRVGDHLGRSYRQGDKNYQARHLYAQYLFCIGDVKKAQVLFEDVQERAPPEFRTSSPEPNGGLARHLPRGVGRIVTKDGTYCFIRSPSYDKGIYANEAESDVAIWEKVQSGSQVDFKVMFRRGGPVAHDLRPVSG